LHRPLIDNDNTPVQREPKWGVDQMHFNVPLGAGEPVAIRMRAFAWDPDDITQRGVPLIATATIYLP
jgi:hypothetical protein